MAPRFLLDPARGLALAALLSGCGEPTLDGESRDEATNAPDPTAAAAGFIELPGVDYELGLGADALPLRSMDARLFWAFQPADEDVLDPPLFVFFNGGPGVSSGMLLGLGTGRASIDPKLTGQGATVVDNPHSWTQIGNLLWIDAPQTGFSYGLLDDPGDAEARESAMSIASYNAYRDAADFVRTLLRFLADHPGLEADPIVLVGESYGGTRAQLMLDMLLFPSAYEDGTRRLRDPVLAAIVREHHAQVHDIPENPATVATQFGRQVLIQPLLTGRLQKNEAGLLFEQPGSIIEALAVELGVDFVPCSAQAGECEPYANATSFVTENGRSVHDYRAPASWISDLFALVRYRFNDVNTTEALLQVELETLTGLAASERAGAWRGVTLAAFEADAALGDWPEHVGALEPWDRYFIPFNTEAKAPYYGEIAQSLHVDPGDAHYGELLLSNLVWVDTLITNAAYDLVIHTPGIPPALASYDQLVRAVTVDPGTGAWTIEYTDDAFNKPGSRVVTVPRYEASHAVTYDASGELRDDVALWMAQ